MGRPALDSKRPRAIARFRCTRTGSRQYARRAQEVLRDGATELDVKHAGILDCLLAVSDDSIVGVILFCPCDHQRLATVHAIGVSPQYQRRGIATNLKQRAIDICGKAGAVEIYSEVHRYNYKMQGVNEKLCITSFDVNPEDGKYLLYGAPIANIET